MLDEIEVQPFAGLVNCTLRKLGMQHQHGVLIVAIRRPSGEMIVTPGADTLVSTGDVLIVVGEPAKVKRLSKVIRGELKSK